MFSIQRFINEFTAMFRLLNRRHAVILLIFALWVIIKHLLFFKFGQHMSVGMNEQLIFDKIAVPDTIIGILSILVSLDVFAKLRSTTGGIHYLMTPANTGEKFTAAWFYSTLLTFFTLTLVYNLTHIICMMAGNWLYDLNAGIHFQSWKSISMLFSLTMLVQSIYFLGSVYFKKNPIGKTTLAIIAAIIIIGYSAVYYFDHYLKETVHTMSMNFQGPNNFDEVSADMFPPELRSIYYTLKTMFYTLPFVFWGGAYWALKKKEV